MSAWCEFCLNFSGNDEDFEKLIDKLYEIEGEKRKNTRFFQPFDINGHTITANNGNAINIWGADYLNPDADMYLDLARAVPDSSFDVTSHRLYEGGGGGCETNLEVYYSNRKLVFKSLAGIDYVTMLDVVTGSDQEWNCENVAVAFTGESKFFENKNSLKRYLNDWDIAFYNDVNSKVNYLICNDPNSTSSKVSKAKELGIEIISEAKFVRMFLDVYDFEDNLNDLLKDYTYEDLCKDFEVGDDLTKEVFEQICEDPDYEAFVLSGDSNLSLNGEWEEEVYILGDNGEFSLVR